MLSDNGTILKTCAMRKIGGDNGTGFQSVREESGDAEADVEESDENHRHDEETTEFIPMRSSHRVFDRQDHSSTCNGNKLVTSTSL